MWRYQTALILFQGGETRSAPFCEGRVDISTYFFLNKVRIGFVCDISLWLTFNVEYYDRRWNLQVCEDCFSLYRDPEIYSVCRYYMFTVFSSRYRSSIQCTVFSMPLYVGAVFSVQYLVFCTQFANLSIQYAGVMSLWKFFLSFYLAWILSCCPKGCAFLAAA